MNFGLHNHMVDLRRREAHELRNRRAKQVAWLAAGGLLLLICLQLAGHIGDRRIEALRAPAELQSRY